MVYYISIFINENTINMGKFDKFDMLMQTDPIEAYVYFLELCQRDSSIEEIKYMIDSGKKVTDDVVWFFLKLVILDDWFVNYFNSNIHLSLKDKLSGGQKSRILLAKTLFRASEFDRNSTILILDEPDKGLPSNLTIDIITNIVNWFKFKGILLLTLHTREAQDLGYTHLGKKIIRTKFVLTF
ncbi:MdlB - ABC-type multidrug transport system [Tupanvirus deep ocean]|uniref:MdlB - ABC-type multidrug transport system n=2 Tax=Tupanvirus TaxID=2094720 RepID=A0AC62A8I7_9VIRU|nr:MdlB - ABC-type multidrug transport system [Tupanvirus deep ocean]QKU34094.1 MdlB - ABC-type multidrug transport system [Tupanvirus deep ocean]